MASWTDDYNFFLSKNNNFSELNMPKEDQEKIFIQKPQKEIDFIQLKKDSFLYIVFKLKLLKK